MRYFCEAVCIYKNISNIFVGPLLTFFFFFYSCERRPLAALWCRRQMHCVPVAVSGDEEVP